MPAVKGVYATPTGDEARAMCEPLNDSLRAGSEQRSRESRASEPTVATNDGSGVRRVEIVVETCVQESLSWTPDLTAGSGPSPRALGRPVS